MVVEEGVWREEEVWREEGTDEGGCDTSSLSLSLGTGVLSEAWTEKQNHTTSNEVWS